MSCNVGTRVKDLYKCGTTLVIGVAGASATNYLVYFKNWTTGRIFVVPVTSGGIPATLSITLPVDNIEADHDYEVWVTLATATNPEEKQNVTISSVVYTSFAVHFKTIYDTSNAVEDLTSQSFTVA